MQLRFNSEETAFRDEVREFLAKNLAPELAQKEAQGFHLHRADYADWHRTLYRQGWAAPAWPKAYGGTGWTPVQRHIWEIECGLANAPEISVIGLGLVGPLICEFGSEAQKQQYLPGILSGEQYFCQGFSETGAGSDLAKVRTQATREGGTYVINGHKIWTSHATYSDFMACLCRTNTATPPQKGLSMLIVPMDAPGVTIRPIDSIDGCYSVNEVFLDDVRVPFEACIGEPDRAWSYTKFLLNNERTHNAYIGLLRRYLQRLRAICSRNGHADSLAHTDGFRQQLALLEIDVDALEWSVLRVLCHNDSPEAAAAASAIKVTASELLLRASDLELQAQGPECLPHLSANMPEPLPADALPHGAGKVAQYLYWRAASIFGGANEIQRGIIWNTLFRH